MSRLLKALQLLKEGQFKELLIKFYRFIRDRFTRYRIPPLPYSLLIEPTNACNLHCPTCPTGAGKMNRPKRMMGLKEFQAIIDEVKGYAHDIVLWNYGEPFLNKELLNMIHYAVSNGMQVITSTNGEFFKTKGFCRQIINSGLQRLLICLDGADQETIAFFRKGANFETIVKGIYLLSEAKQELSSKTPSIELQFIVMKHNEHQRDTMKNLAIKIGVNVYSEKTVGIDANDPEFQEMCKKFLPQDLSLSRYYVRADSSFGLKRTNANYCSWVNRCAVINSDGSVVPCCYDLYSRHIMGNVFQESLQNIWKSGKYQAFRKQIRLNRKNISICNICSEGVAVSKRQSIDEYQKK